MLEPWTECNNFCTFCYLGEKNRNTPTSVKLKNLDAISKILYNKFFIANEQYKAIGLMGGEFFQGQMNDLIVKHRFFEITKQIFKYIEENKVRDFWCYCTLTIGDQKDLYELIDLFDQNVTDKEKHHFWILVSYDSWGRFNQPGKFENWDKHMLNLQKYPFIKFNITSILSQDFCEKVLTGSIKIKELQSKYKSKFFFKQPTGTLNYESKEEFSELNKRWFVKRKTFIDFLKKIKNEDEELFDEVLNIDLRADDILNDAFDFELKHRDKETWVETDNETIDKCGHAKYYQCYSDSDACCVCDYLKIKNVNVE